MQETRRQDFAPVRPPENQPHLAAQASHPNLLTRTQEVASLWVLALACAALWLVLGRYSGLQHDAQVYVLQALARLDPTVFGDDLFLKFGSQDQYSIFSLVSAEIIGLLGVDHGAALLTLAALLGFYLAVWLFARHLTGAAHAWLVLALLIVLPGWYGASQVFQIIERFFSARLPAEALCVLALWALVAARPIACALLFALAFAVHPLMTAPAAIIAVSYALGRRIPTLHPSVVPLFVAACAVLGAFILRGDSALMSDDWLGAVRLRSGFLFLDNWSAADWSNVVWVGSTIWLVMVSGAPSRDRLLSGSALWTMVAGLLLTAVTTWVWPLALIVQGQPWRWMWMAVLFSIVFLPAALARTWQAGGASKAATTLFAAGWCLAAGARFDPYLLACGTAILSTAALLFAVRDHISAHSRLLMVCAWLVGALAAAWVASLLLAEMNVDIDLGRDPLWVQRVTGALKIPAVGIIAIVTIWLLLRRPVARQWIMAPVALAAAILISGATSGAWSSWSTDLYARLGAAGFGEWQAIVRSDQEILWPAGLPVTWFAIGRRSYLSVSQLAGIVFSEATYREATERAEALSEVFPVHYWLDKGGRSRATELEMTISDVEVACRAPGVDYVVTGHDLGLGAPTAEWPTAGMFVYLHDCGTVLQRHSP